MAPAQRYTAVAIVLHWAIAFAVALNIPLGFWMHEAILHTDTIPAASAAFQLHKSIGLTVLLLSLIRLGWRLTHKRPPFPPMPAWEKFAALAAHWAFYVVIIALPLTGWLYASTAWSARDDHALPVTTYYFHLFRVPPLFDLPHAPEATRRALAFFTIKTHWTLAWGTVGLAVLHVAAALKHQFVDRDEVLAHMVPGLKAPNETELRATNPARLAALGAGFALIAVAATALTYALTHLTTTAAPAVSQATALPVETSIVGPETPPLATASAPPSVGAPPAWRVNSAASSIGFSATYTDEEGDVRFNGHFNRWRADIHFDPDNLAQSSAVVRIETASAVDGIAMHEQTLPGEIWFDVAHHPTAEFRTTSIRHISGDRYQAIGRLTIKGRTLNVTMPFTLTINGAHASMSGHLSLNRAAADIGVRDSEGSQHISRDIDVNVAVEATRG